MTPKEIEQMVRERFIEHGAYRAPLRHEELEAFARDVAIRAFAEAEATASDLNKNGAREWIARRIRELSDQLK